MFFLFNWAVTGIKKIGIKPINNLMVQVKGLEPPWITPLDPKSSASANFATPAN